ncbi:hypothetical protein GBAR_LOCUS28130, partial [Geodia barretti]
MVSEQENTTRTHQLGALISSTSRQVLRWVHWEDKGVHTEREHCGLQAVANPRQWLYWPQDCRGGKEK